MRGGGSLGAYLAGGVCRWGGGRRVCHGLQPPPHLLTTLPAPAGGGRCVRHATAATGRRRRRGTRSAARRTSANARCRSRAAWASGLGWRRRSWGGWSSQASNAAARQRVRRPSPRPRDRPRSRRCSGPARAAMTCRPKPWDGQRVAPVVPPAGTVDRGDGAERRVGGHWSRLRGQSVSPPLVSGRVGDWCSGSTGTDGPGCVGDRAPRSISGSSRVKLLAMPMRSDASMRK